MNIKNILLATLILSTSCVRINSQFSLSAPELALVVVGCGAVGFAVGIHKTTEIMNQQHQEVLQNLKSDKDRVDLSNDRLKQENKQLTNQVSQVLENNSVTHIGGGIVVAPALFEQITLLKNIAATSETEKQDLIICNGDKNHSEKRALYCGNTGIIIPDNKNFHLAKKYETAIKNVIE